MDERYGSTQIHPLALLLTVGMGIAMLVVRRDRTAIPLLIVACFITHAQRIVIGGLDFSMLRILVLFGWVRVLYRGETRHYTFHPLDALIPIWLFFGALSGLVGPRGSTSLFITKMGYTLDAAGIYYLFRIILTDVRDVNRTIRTFGVIAMVIVGPMLLENLTGRNFFALLGGVPEHTNIRNGRFRCQASFSHPLMAGNFGATTTALLGALWLAYPKERVRHTAALVAAAGIVVLSNSSGPLMAFLTALIAWGLWYLRRYMKLFTWGTIAAVIAIHFIREKPAWHLIGRLSSITGGTGWHRVALIDAAIDHFHEWWLIGGATTHHWKGAQGSDITNQYILEGLRGGIGALITFVTMIVIGLRTAGRSVRAAERRRDWPRSDRRLAMLLSWGVGACLASHAMAFIGVSYFGQLLSILYLHLAMVPSLYCAVTLNAAPVGAAKRKRKVRRKRAGRTPAGAPVPRPPPGRPATAGAPSDAIRGSGGRDPDAPPARRPGGKVPL